MKLSVFCGVSVDGFLARPNHALDFLDTPDQGPHGFSEFYSSVDVVLIGRRTFDVARSFPGPWGYGRKPVFVLTHRPPDFSSLKGAVVEAISGQPPAVAAQLEARGFQHVYVDGGLTIQQFLAAGLIDRLIVTRVPVLIGQGIPLFGPVPHDIPLHHVATHSYKGGLVQSEYEIAPPQPTPTKKKPAKAPAKSRKKK
ncbi:MAG: dihydrofolate reductase family protein [Acidobacteriaceae bacterium]